MMAYPDTAVNGDSSHMPQSANHFPNDLRRLRKQRGLSQEKLAALVRCSSKHLGRLERGQYIPKADLLHDLAAALGFPVEALFNESWSIERKSRLQSFI